jgi:hypothetical protein
MFSAADATAAIAAVHTFLVGVGGLIGYGVTMQVRSAVKVIDWTTGTLVGMVSGTGVTAVLGSTSGAILTAEGPLVQWFTSTIVNGRILRGRTFIVPGGAGDLTPAGIISGGMVTALQGDATTLLGTSAVTLSVWHRPTAGGAGGTVGAVTSANVPTKVAVLRSRRD